jgi:hypothetical protein
MRQQCTKWQWRIEKPLKFSGIWEHFVQPPSPPMYLVFFSDFKNEERMDGEKGYR